MLKKILLTLLVLLGAVSLYAQDEAIPWRKNITLLLVPREPAAIQIAQDISRRYPVLLVCYQPAEAGVALHAWNGTGWVTVSNEDYTNGTFFANRPLRMVIVEKKNHPAPGTLVPDGFWCTSGNRLTSTNPRVMIHLLGRSFDFPYRYWMQFSKRYGYALNEINPGLVHVFWWQLHRDNVPSAIRNRNLEADMKNWLPLNITPPEPIEPVVIEEEPETLPPTEIPAKEVLGKPAKETLSTTVETPAKNVSTHHHQTHIEKIAAAMEAIGWPEKEKTPSAEKSDPPAADANPFSADEIPPAGVVLPPMEK